MTVRERILKIMQKKGIGKAELARLMNEGRHFTQKRLNPTPENKATISADEVPRFADALGVAIQELYSDAPAPASQQKPDVAHRLYRAVRQVLAEAGELANPEIARQAAQEGQEAAPPIPGAVLDGEGREAPPERPEGPSGAAESPAFGTPEYIDQRTQELLAQLAREFAALPVEDQEAVWAMVEERRRLREREGQPYTEPRGQPNRH